LEPYGLLGGGNLPSCGCSSSESILKSEKDSEGSVRFQRISKTHNKQKFYAVLHTDPSNENDSTISFEEFKEEGKPATRTIAKSFKI